METSNLQETMSATGTSGNLVEIKNVFFKESQENAKTAAKQLDIPTLLPVDEGIIGDFHWFWNSGGVFNTETYDWINNVFRYDDQDNCIETDGSSLTTAYYNLMDNISFELSSTAEEQLNTEIVKNATIVNSIIGTWKSTFGAIPSDKMTSTISQMGYITNQILSWGATDLTLDKLRSSLDPISLLGNRPLGSEQFIGIFMEYLGKTSSVASFQQLQSTRNQEILSILKNLQPAPEKVKKGWMKTSYNAVSQIVPEVNISQSTSTIVDNLYPDNSGNGVSYSVKLNVTKIDSQTVKVSAQGGVSGSGWIDFFRLSGGASASYNMFSFNQDIQTCEIEITFKGITKVTPSYAPYSVTSNSGWWMPKVIQDALNYTSSESGYKFNTTPHYNFETNGNFGVLSNIVIAQSPTFTLTYSDVDYSYFKEVFEEHSSWGISFLGIPLAGGSQSYFHSEIKQDTTKNTVTITASPVTDTDPKNPLDQLAFVVGAEILWPGVS